MCMHLGMCISWAYSHMWVRKCVLWVRTRQISHLLSSLPVNIEINICLRCWSFSHEPFSSADSLSTLTGFLSHSLLPVKWQGDNRLNMQTKVLPLRSSVWSPFWFLCLLFIRGTQPVYQQGNTCPSWVRQLEASFTTSAVTWSNLRTWGSKRQSTTARPFPRSMVVHPKRGELIVFMHLVLHLVSGPVKVWLLQLNLNHICHLIHLRHLTVRTVVKVVCPGIAEVLQTKR